MSGSSSQPPGLAEAGARGRLRAAGLAALALALLAAPVAVRVSVDGRSALASADAAARADDVDGELRWLGRAARGSSPLASHDEQARARLVERARAAEREQPERALEAWRELRRALLATRTLGVAGGGQEPLLREANAKIVELMVAQAEAQGRSPAPDRWAAELDEDLRPRGRSVAAAACFALFWLACVAWFVLGLDAEGRLRPRPAVRIGGVLLAALLGWILLL